MPEVAAVALGSNLGDRKKNLLDAVERIGALLGVVLAVSSFYDTAPVEYLEQPRFLNGALLLETMLAPVELMRGLLAVELAMGRSREGVVTKGPRVIDLDLLLYGDVVRSTEELTLPHPAMANRAFVLEPLAEIAGGMVHPVSGLTVAEMLERVRGQAARI